MDILHRIKHETVLLDGAMGTMLQAAGLKLGEHPEVFNIEHPEIVKGIHAAYAAAGSQVLYANTFGANAHKLQGTGYGVAEIIQAGLRLAKEAGQAAGAAAALDIGPIGELLAPMGTLSFEEAYELFAEQVRAANGLADLVVIETMTDLLEAKAALLAVKENSELPVMCTMTFEETGRTFTGVPVSAMALTLTGLGADAIGVNCSLGPDQLYELVKEMARCTPLPLIVKPNAGLPCTDEAGCTHYNVSAKEFAASMARYAEIGVTVFGGCCGSTPEYIRALKQALAGAEFSRAPYQPISAVCSGSKTVLLDRVRVIGERINPTGKKRFQQALLEQDMDYILRQAMEQTDSGADILDVNVGMPQLDEAAMMKKTVLALQGVTDVPLQLDSSDAAALEAGLRVYNGKPIINSVNGEAEVLERILPLAKKYGAAVVGLTLNSGGIPGCAQERVAIAETILQAALSHGIAREDVFIDCLTLTVSAQQKDAAQTLEAVRRVRAELGLQTVLGVSNISFGLPNRELLNRTFLTQAMMAGLTMPILNPSAASMMDAVYAHNVLCAVDEGCNAYVQRFSQTAASALAAPVVAEGGKDIGYYIERALTDSAVAECERLLREHDALKVVNEYLIPALDSIGQKYETGKIFLPQLISSAECAKAAFEAVKRKLSERGEKQGSRLVIVMATVQGDIHDIGKNIVKVVLENYGYRIIDLGRDVPPQEVVRAAKENQADMVGLSALMTTTLKSMAKTIEMIHEEGLAVKIFVGGAVLTEQYAMQIGADYYAKDAQESVRIAKTVEAEKCRK